MSYRERIINRPAFYDLEIADVVRETEDARSVVFRIPPELQDAFAYRPGQFLTLEIPDGDACLPRCYSASSSPLLDEPLRVTVKRVEHGRASNWIVNSLKAGDRLRVSTPAGQFTPKALESDLLLLAGGSGITPILSILRSALHAGQGRIRLLYANRDESSVIFAATLAELARQYPDRLDVIHWLDSVQGPPATAPLSRLCAGWDQADAFICGPAPFMDAAQQALGMAGLAPSQIHLERFSSPPTAGDEAEALGAESAQTCTINVRLDGAEHQLQASQGQILLDSLEAEGIDAPYSCRTGACAACMCRLQSGKVSLIDNQVLDENDLEQGWILACQARLESAEISIDYPE